MSLDRERAPERFGARSRVRSNFVQLRTFRANFVLCENTWRLPAVLFGLNFVLTSYNFVLASHCGQFGALLDCLVAGE